MKATTIVIALAMTAATQAAFAGVAPSTAASAAAQSGAKIAPVKSNPASETKGNAGSQSGTTD